MGPERLETGNLSPSPPALASSSQQEVLAGPLSPVVPTRPAPGWTILQGKAVPAPETRRWEFATNEPGPGEKGSACREEADGGLRGSWGEARERLKGG